MSGAMANDYDVLIVGAGPAGVAAAMTLARGGQSVLLVDDAASGLAENMAGTGVLHEAARRLRELKAAPDFGLCLPSLDVRADWFAIQQRREQMIEHQHAEWLERLQQIPELDYRPGHAEFSGPNRAHIAGNSGEALDVHFSRAIIATGAQALRPDVPGIDHHRVLLPRELTAISRPPKRLVVLGSAPAGVELAQIFQAFGSDVLLLDPGPNLLEGWDAEIAEILRRRLLTDGISVERGCRLERISNTGGGVFVEYRTATGESRHHFTEQVLLAMGRQPRLDGLGLEKAGITSSDDGIEVDAKLQTSQPHIHAIGDATGASLSARCAMRQGEALARRLLGEKAPLPERRKSAAVVASFPEIGRAGMTEEQADREKIDYGIVRYDLSRHLHSRLAGENDGLLKLLYRHGSREIIGVHVLADDAGELMALAAVILEADLTLDTIARAITPQSTLGEAFALAAAMVPEGV